MEKVITINNRDETLAFGEYLGKLLKPHMLLTLNGDLGAGKTTFTKGIGKGLGIKRIINSPTFTILKQYQGNYQLSHFDAYRLEGQSEDLGFEEIFDSDDICVVEWPEFLEDILPQERLAMTIKRIDDDHRKFILKPIGVKGIVKRINKICIKYDYEKSKYVGGIAWGYGPEERLSREKMNSVEVDFEGIKVNTFACYDEYLTNLYGDYMKLPSEEERRIHLKEIKKLGKE